MRPRPLYLALLCLALVAAGTACEDSLGAETRGPDVRPAEKQAAKVLPRSERTLRPAFAGVTLDGKLLSARDYRGTVTVVNVWWTLCGPCRLEQPVLERVWRRYRDDGLVKFVGINIRDSSKAASLAFIDEFDVTYPSIYDPGSSVAAKFRMIAPPATFVLDKEGRVAAKILGAASDEDELRATIDEVLRT